MSKPDEGIARKENYKPVSVMKIDTEVLHKILESHIQPCIKRIIYHNQGGFILGMADWFNIQKSNTVIHHFHRLKIQSHMVISIDAEKAFYRIQRALKIKTVILVGIKGDVLN